MDSLAILAKPPPAVPLKLKNKLFKLLNLAGTENNVGASLGYLAGDADSLQYFYCLPLMSIFSLTNNYVPLFALGGTPLRVELQVVSSIAQVARSLIAKPPPAVPLKLKNNEFKELNLAGIGMETVVSELVTIIFWL